MIPGFPIFRIFPMDKYHVKMKKQLLLIILIISFPVANDCTGQGSYAGTFTMSSGQVTLTLNLQQTANNLTGTLSSTTGVSFQIQGEVSEGTAMGVCTSADGAVFFEAYLDGTDLTFSMIEPDQNNMPDYNQVQYLAFTKSAGQEQQNSQTESAMGQLFGDNQGQDGNKQNEEKKNDYQQNNQGNKSAQATGSSAISANEVGDPSWGFKFVPPTGWVHQQSADGAVLGHNTVPGMILIMVHMAENMQQLQQEMQKGIQEEGSYLMLSGSLQSSSQNVLSGDYTGMMDGTQVKAKGMGILSPNGGGAYIIAVSTPEAFGSELISAAESIAKNMQYFKVETSDLMNHFAGNWSNFTSNTSNYIFFGPDGSYSDQYESSYSGDFTDGAGNYTGGWNAMGQDQSKGRWTVRGNKEAGTIIVKLNNGNEIYYEYKVHKEKGFTYYNEYWFNGSHYARK